MPAAHTIIVKCSCTATPSSTPTASIRPRRGDPSMTSVRSAAMNGSAAGAQHMRPSITQTGCTAATAAVTTPASAPHDRRATRHTRTSAAVERHAANQ